MALSNNGTSTTTHVPVYLTLASFSGLFGPSFPFAATATIQALSATSSSSPPSSSFPPPTFLPPLFATSSSTSPLSLLPEHTSFSIARDTFVTVASALLKSNIPLQVNGSYSHPTSSPLSPPFLAPFSYASFFMSDNSSFALDNASFANSTLTTTASHLASRYSLPQIVLIALVAGFLSLMTVVGNFMVMISFKMDKQLQTISNYFLFSLAVADFAIGLISMPLNTVYLLMGEWPFGTVMCDTWLALDYLASNASVLNLLIISFDRYFSVTRPLTYRARRTTKRAIFMISCAWIISLILWPPWIYSWPYIEGERTVEDHKCYIQFLETNLYITFGTAIAAFYIPVTVMCVLYWQIWRETEKRQKDLTNLQAGKQDNSKRSTSSDDVAEQEELNKRSRSDSSAAVPAAEEIETTYVPTAMCIENPRYLKVPGRTKPRTFTEIICYTCLKYCKIDHEPDFVEEDSTSDGGHGSPGNTTPASVETPVQSSVSRCTSLTLRTEPLTAVMSASNTAARSRLETMIPLLDRPTGNGVRSSLATTPSAPNPPRLHFSTRSHSSDSVFTILIRLPLDTDRGDDNQPSIQMIAEEEEDGHPHELLDSNSQQVAHLRKESPRFERAISETSELSAGMVSASPAPAGTGDISHHPAGCSTATCTPLNQRRISQPPESIKIPLNAKLVPKQVMTKAAKKKKKKTQERKQDRKAAKTLSAILLAFIITWTPYNVMVLIRTLATCGDACIPAGLWDLVYYLCYINSTVNPLCYALCNASFRRTYVRILTCKWHTKKRNPNRGFYN